MLIFLIKNFFKCLKIRDRYLKQKPGFKGAEYDYLCGTKIK